MTETSIISCLIPRVDINSPSRSFKTEIGYDGDYERVYMCRTRATLVGIRLNGNGGCQVILNIHFFELVVINKKY